MVKKVIWTNNADRIFTKILEFYIERNGTKTYSQKLNFEIQTIIAILTKEPFLGKKTDIKGIRTLTINQFKIFYQIDNELLIIHQVWDMRQNPESLDVFTT